MARDTDVVVVGGGITGVATLHALARSGVDAVLLERFELGHTHGSSHGTSRIFRLSYPDAAYTRRALTALAAWRELETECGEKLIVHTGSLDLGDEAADSERSLTELGIAFETLTGAEAVSRWPLSVASDEELVFQPDGGFSLADRANAAFTAGALAAGAELVEGERVTQLAVGAQGVTVATETRELTARAVVVAAGAWARTLLEPLGIDIPVVATRETVAYYALPGVEEVPPLIEYPSAASPLPDSQAYYALPAPGRGLKAGVHQSGPATDPEQEGVPDAAMVEATSAWVARRYPTANPVPVDVETCIYTNTPDKSFLIERYGPVVVASPCSGHGFKFAPAHGRMIASLAREAAAR